MGFVILLLEYILYVRTRALGIVPMIPFFFFFWEGGGVVGDFGGEKGFCLSNMY